MRISSVVLTIFALSLSRPLPAQTDSHLLGSGADTAWKESYPLTGLKNAGELVASFKAKARNLGRDGKLRVLIIGDSLSDGEYHWSHYFRRDLQAAYGDGGPGAIWSAFAGGLAGHGFAPGWLWSRQGFHVVQGIEGRVENRLGRERRHLATPRLKRHVPGHGLTGCAVLPGRRRQSLYRGLQ